jgi:hypothetical protein
VHDGELVVLMIQRMLGYEDSWQEINFVGPRNKVLCECWVELGAAKIQMSEEDIDSELGFWDMPQNI